MRTSFFSFRLYRLLHERMMFPVLALVLISVQSVCAQGRSGEQIYRQQCASCHGVNGEGSAEYKRPLRGDRSVAQLARFIAKSMPKDSEKKCTGEDAQKVAVYIYETFYSKAAQARNKPPRIELSRLTVRQYRQAAADLIGTFRGSSGRMTLPAAASQGLKGEYFKSRRLWRQEERVRERIDPVVQFDFGVAGPEPDKF